jgi:hypothetical protein
MISTRGGYPVSDEPGTLAYGMSIGVCASCRSYVLKALPNALTLTLKQR